MVVIHADVIADVVESCGLLRTLALFRIVVAHGRGNW